MVDKVYINDLVARCIIGAREEERSEKQEVVINLTLFVDLREAGLSDNLEDTIDYSLLKGEILHEVEDSNFHLIEALAQMIADISLERREVEKVCVSVEKPSALRFARSAEVEITRTRSD